MRGDEQVDKFTIGKLHVNKAQRRRDWKSFSAAPFVSNSLSIAGNQSDRNVTSNRGHGATY